MTAIDATDLLELRSLAEWHAMARHRLDPVYYDFITGGAGDERTVRDNEAAFGRVRLLPRVLSGASDLDLGVGLPGGASAMPILVAPTAFHRLLHSDGELATARAAAATGAVMIVSMAATTSVGRIVAEARRNAPDPTLWFQLYVQPDPAVTEALVRRAEAAGVRAIVVTVDSPVRGRHARADRHGFRDLPPGLACENLRGLPGSDPDEVRDIVMSPGITWSHVDRLRAMTDLPVLLKGVLHPADAAMAIEHGVAGIVVSNHGGRQLDTAVASLDALPAVAAAVGGRIPLILDGGIRRGTDVVKAMALGATAVAIGRPALWGLAVAGEAGVARVLRTLRTEFAEALALCGAASPADLGPDLVRTH